MVRDLRETISSKQFSVPIQDFLCACRRAMTNGMRMLASVRWQDCYQSLAVFLDQFAIDTRTIIEAFEIGFRHKLQEVAIARLVFREQNEARCLIVNSVFFLRAGPRRDMEIDADYRLQALLFAFFVEFDCAVHVAVVGERESALPVLGCRSHELRNFRQRLEKRVVRVSMQVNKFPLAHISQYITG